MYRVHDRRRPPRRQRVWRDDLRARRRRPDRGSFGGDDTCSAGGRHRSPAARGLDVLKAKAATIWRTAGRAEPSASTAAWLRPGLVGPAVDRVTGDRSRQPLNRERPGAGAPSVAGPTLSNVSDRVTSRRCWTPSTMSSSVAAARAGSPSSSARKRHEGASSRSCSRRPRPAARRSTASCSWGRPASARRPSPRSLARGSRGRAPDRRRPGARAEGRHGRDPDEPRGAGRAVRGRDPPGQPRAIEEIFYPALEDFRLDIVVGQGPAARTLTLDLPPFTLIGATTRTGLLTTPLRDRFGMTFRLGYYDAEQLTTIVGRSRADPRDRDRGRGRPRRSPGGPVDAANRQPDPSACPRRGPGAARGRDHDRVAREALELLEVDDEGLERTDRELLEAIALKFGGGPVGLSTLAVRPRRGAGHDRGRVRALPPASSASCSGHRAAGRSPSSAAPTSARCAAATAAASSRPPH